MSADAAEAERHLLAGRWDEAIDAYAAALAIMPDQPDWWFNRGWAERQARHFDAALASYGEALRRGIAAPEAAHLNRAVILSEHLQRTDEAIAELERAVTLNPALIEGWLNLGNAQEDRGHVSAARHAYAAAVKIAPANGRAHARLAALDQHEGASAQAVSRLKRTLDLAPGPADRAEMLFALAHALDDAGDHADAAQAVAAANWIALQLAPARYDRAAQDRLIDDLIRCVPAALPAAEPGIGPRPIFIVGMFRSGSTLAERLIARHPAVTGAGELDLVPALAAGALQPYPETLRLLDRARAEDLRRDYQDAVAAILPGATTFTDKRPDNFLHIGLIKAMFPEAKIVHTVRAPLDNLTSIHFQHFGEGVRYGHDLGDAAHHYLAYRRLMAHWQRLFGDDIIELDYDRLVTAPEATLRPVLAALRLDWTDAVLRPEAAEGAVRTASVWQVRRPLHRRSSGRAANYAALLAPARAMLERAGLL